MKRCRPALGTFVDIEVRRLHDGPAGDDAVRLAAIDAAFAAIERVDALMSFHRDTSDLSRLNRAAAGTNLSLDAWTVEVLGLAADLQRQTGGLFDCAVGGDLIAAGLLPGAAPVAGNGSLLRDVEITGLAMVHVKAPVCLDLGGVAKGYAVDRAIEVLRDHGAAEASVNAGGDLRVLGRAQPVYLRPVGSEGGLAPVGALGDGALATSSVAYSGHRDGEGRWRSALVDPRSRACVEATQSFSVVAERCALADGLTKVVAVTGRTDHPSLRHYGATAFIL